MGIRSLDKDLHDPPMRIIHLTIFRIWDASRSCHLDELVGTVISQKNLSNLHHLCREPYHKFAKGTSNVQPIARDGVNESVPAYIDVLASALCFPLQPVTYRSPQPSTSSINSLNKGTAQSRQSENRERPFNQHTVTRHRRSVVEISPSLSHLLLRHWRVD